MSRGFLRGLFGPDLPRWACEFRPTGVVVVQSTGDRTGVLSRAVRPLPAGALVPDVKGVNVHDGALVRTTLEDALNEAGFNESELVLVVPDDAVRISLVEAESLPGAESERIEFIRWKLKKHVPFDVSSAGVTYTPVSKNGTTRLLAVVSPPGVTRQYERVVKDLGLHPGIVCPSTTAALNLTEKITDAADRLFVKVAPQSIVSAILTGNTLRFYRKIPRGESIEEAVHPTLMYYQDHLVADSGGPGITDAILCVDLDNNGVESAAQSAVGALGLSVVPLDSPDLPDVYKPALGAVQS